MLGRALPAFRCRSGPPVWAAAGRGRAMPRKGKAQTKDFVKPSVPPVPVATDKSGSVVISVYAKPGSKQNAVTDLTTDAVSVAIAAPPSEGEANAELCRYLSKVLEVKKSDVVLEKGSKSREKVVKILAPLTPEDVLEKLRKRVPAEAIHEQRLNKLFLQLQRMATFRYTTAHKYTWWKTQR